MMFFRLPREFSKLNKPKLESLQNIKGYYGIEFLYIKGEFQVFFFLNDKNVSNSKKKISTNELFTYFDSFGMSREDMSYAELSNQPIEKIVTYKDFELYSAFLDFSNASNVQFSQKGMNNNFHFNKRLNHFTDNPNFFLIILTYLLEFNQNFIWQLYFSSKSKGNFFIASQLAIFIKKKMIKTLRESLDNNLTNLFSDFFIKIKKSKFHPLKKKFLLDSINKNYPYKWFNKPILLINDLFRIPTLQHLARSTEWSFKEEFNFKEENINKKGLPIGIEVIHGIKCPPFVRLSLEDLTSHFSCFGITSQGKSRLMYNILIQIDESDKNFLVIDTKGEYLEALSTIKKPLLYYKVGSLEFPIQINVFDVPRGVNRDEHEFFLYSLLLGIMGEEITPQMNRILYKSISYIINTKGNFNDFLNVLENPKPLNIKGSYLELSGAGVINRLVPLYSGPGKSCFCTNKSNIDYYSMIKKNIVIDLSLFEQAESTVTRKIFVNTFLHYFLNAIKSKNSTIREKGDISNFIFIEEIQKIAPIHYQGRNEINSFVGLAPWTVRAYGVCLGFIGSDLDVETPILTNTGINLFFYIKSSSEKVLKLLNIDIKEFKKYMEELKKRKRFVLSIKGELKLVESFEFTIPKGQEIKNLYMNLDKNIK